MAKKKLMNALAGAGMGYIAGKMYEDKMGTGDRTGTPAPVTRAKVQENVQPFVGPEVPPVVDNPSSRKGSVETGTGRAKAAKIPVAPIDVSPVAPPAVQSYPTVDAFKADRAPTVPRPYFPNESQIGVRNPATAAVLRRREREAQEAIEANTPRGYAVDPMLRKADGGKVKGYADGGKVGPCSPRSFPKKGK